MWDVVINPRVLAPYHLIFPIAQHKVDFLLERLISQPIKRIYLFGSSLTDLCTQDSDVDIAIVPLHDASDIRPDLTGIDFDYDVIFWNDTVSADKLIYDEILEKGVLLWETKDCSV